MLPPVEETPVVLVRFTTKATADLISFTKEHLEGWNLLVAAEERSEVSSGVRKKGKDEDILGITTTQDELEHEAEVRAYVKRTKTGMMDMFTVTDRDEFENSESPDFFTFAERSMLVEDLFNQVPVLKENSISSNLSRELKRLGAKFDEGGKSLTLRQVLVNYGFVDCISPLHYKPEVDRIVKGVMNPFTRLPLQAIRDYYGEEVALYFAWMNTIIKWLFIPAISSVGLFFARTYNQDTIEDCILTPFFGVGMFLWSVSFARYWTRRESYLSYEWGTLFESGFLRRHFQTRAEFKGTVRRSPITGEMEIFYPKKKRFAKYLVSASVTLYLLAKVFTVMIISLNMQGYVKPWGEDDFHPFHYPFFSRLSEEGHLFDASTWRAFLPGIFHGIAIMLMNTGYRRVAENLTNWENHETDIDHENSLILKRFCFEAFDAYISLFYLAFYEQDMPKLRGELVTMFNISVFRRLLLEYLIPMVSLKMGHKKKVKERMISVSRLKKHDDLVETKYSALMTAEADRADYELYDDYLEMVIEFGYLCLFASAYPLAACVSVLSRMVELRSDCLQMSRVFKKMRAVRTNSIGTWNFLISSIVWSSALTNCIIFSYTSRQMMQFIPAFYYTDEDGDHDVLQEKEWLVVYIVFGLERIMLVVGIVINLLIPTIPSDIATKVDYQNYVRYKEARALRILRRSKRNLDKNSNIDELLSNSSNKFNEK